MPIHKPRLAARAPQNPHPTPPLAFVFGVCGVGGASHMCTHTHTHTHTHTDASDCAGPVQIGLRNLDKKLGQIRQAALNESPGDSPLPVVQQYVRALLICLAGNLLLLVGGMVWDQQLVLRLLPLFLAGRRPWVSCIVLHDYCLARLSFERKRA